MVGCTLPVTVVRATLDVTYNVLWSGTGNTQTGQYIRFHNTGATSVVVSWAQGGVAKTAGTTLDMLVYHNGISGWPSPWAVSSGTNSVTVPAGQWKTMDFNVIALQTAGASPQVGNKNFTVQFDYFDGAIRKTAVTFARTFVVQTAAASQMVALPAGALPTAPAGSTYAGTPGTSIWWGDVIVNAPPPTGKITAMGAHVGLNGACKVEIYLGPIPHKFIVAGSATTHGTAGATFAPLVYNQATPATDGGKEYRIVLNNVTVKAGIIELDSNGGFDIVYDMGASQAEYVPDPVLDEEGELAPWDGEANPESTPDPSHERDDPPAVTANAPEPQTDNTANTTVRQEYAAVRAAVEDAMHVPQPTFDFAGWERPGRIASNPLGEGMGEAMSASMAGGTQLGGDLKDMGNSLGNGPTGGTAAIQLHSGSGAVIGTILPYFPGGDSWSAKVRAIALIFLTLFFVLALLSIIRSGFAGS